MWKVTHYDHINILTDIQAAVRALKSYIVNHKFVLSCIETLNTLGLDNKIIIEWVSGTHLSKQNVHVVTRLLTGHNLHKSGILPKKLSFSL